jgi:hypothetical protein
VSARCAAQAGAADLQAQSADRLRSARGWRGRVIEFRRAPMLDSEGEVQAWLASQGYGAGVQTVPWPGWIVARLRRACARRRRRGGIAVRRGKSAQQCLWSWSTEGDVKVLCERQLDSVAARLVRGDLDFAVLLGVRDLVGAAAGLERCATDAEAAARLLEFEDDGTEEGGLHAAETRSSAYRSEILGRGEPSGLRLVIEQSDGSAQLFWVRLFSPAIDAAFYLTAAAARTLAADLRAAAALVEASREDGNYAAGAGAAAISEIEVINQPRVECVP